MSLPDYRRKGKVQASVGDFDTTTTTGVNTGGVANALTASTTHTRAGGTALTAPVNRFTTVAGAGDAATLPPLSPGQGVVVYNDGASAMAVFPNGASDSIDGGSAGASVVLTNAKRCLYFCVAANTIVSSQLGAASA